MSDFHYSSGVTIACLLHLTGVIWKEKSDFEDHVQKAMEVQSNFRMNCFVYFNIQSSSEMYKRKCNNFEPVYENISDFVPESL